MDVSWVVYVRSAGDHPSIDGIGDGDRSAPGDNDLTLMLNALPPAMTAFSVLVWVR